MSRTICLTGLLVGVVVSVSVTAARSTHQFESHTFSLDLPPGYAFQSDAAAMPGVGTFGFTTEARGDGTRGLIQVSFVDFTHAPPGETITLERFATAMVDGVRRRRSRWEQAESDMRLGSATAKRIAWSGSMEPGFGRPGIGMRGVMIVGIAKDLGFALHTQDVTAFADTTLPLCEQALLTFVLTPKR